MGRGSPRALLAWVLAVVVVLALGCSSSHEVDPLRGSNGERRLVLAGNGVRVAEAKGPDAETLGVKWLEARVRPLSSTVDRKGVATPSRRTGLGMDYVAHGADGEPLIVGAIALDLGSIARLPLEPTNGQLAGALAPDLRAARLSRRGAKPSPRLTRAEQAAIVRLVLDAFADGGKSAAEANARPPRATVSTSTSTKSVDVVLSGTIRPCAEAGEIDEPCVDGRAPPSDCFRHVCDIEDASLMAEFTEALQGSLKGVYKNKTCLAFLTALGLTAVDTAIVFNGPTELLLAGGAGVLGRKCALSIIEGVIKSMVKNGLLDHLKNVLCASRDATLPALPTVDLQMPDRMLIDVINRIGVMPKASEVKGYYDAVADVFNTVRECTCGFASAKAGQVPVRAQRVVDAQGRIACMPCPEGSHYDPDELTCVPDDEGDLIAICTEGGEKATTTSCGQHAPDVRVIKPELCLDVWVTEYTGEQAANGTIPPPRLETVRISSNGAYFTSDTTIAFEPSFDQCVPADFSGSRLEEAERTYPNDDLSYGYVTTHTQDGVGMHSAMLSPFPGPDGKMHYFPGHACAKDANGTTRCIDSIPVDYLPGSPALAPYSGAAPGFYWCDYQGSKCRDSATAGRNVPKPRTFPSYYPRGFGKDTCANPVPWDETAQDPPSRDLLEDTCEGKPDGVHCSVAPDNRAGGYRCKSGQLVAEVRCQGDLVCVEKPNVDEIQCESPLSKTDCGDKTDGWWCLDVASGTPWMAYCKDKQIALGCSCAACTTGGVKAPCECPMN